MINYFRTTYGHPEPRGKNHLSVWDWVYYKAHPLSSSEKWFHTEFTPKWLGPVRLCKPLGTRVFLTEGKHPTKITCFGDEVSCETVREYKLTIPCIRWQPAITGHPGKCSACMWRSFEPWQCSSGGRPEGCRETIRRYGGWLVGEIRGHHIVQVDTVQTYSVGAVWAGFYRRPTSRSRKNPTAWGQA